MKKSFLLLTAAVIVAPTSFVSADPQTPPRPPRGNPVCPGAPKGTKRPYTPEVLNAQELARIVARQARFNAVLDQAQLDEEEEVLPGSPLLGAPHPRHRFFPDDDDVLGA